MVKKYQRRNKNAIFIQENKEIAAKMEVKLVTKKDKMREKQKKIELPSMCEDKTVTMTPQDKTDRSEYDNTLKVITFFFLLLS